VEIDEDEYVKIEKVSSSSVAHDHVKHARTGHGVCVNICLSMRMHVHPHEHHAKTKRIFAG
jgi:hypothetical protein